MATLLEALIHAPEAFRETAPLNYKKFVAFLASHDELAPLIHIRPSLRLMERTGTVSAGGIVLGKRIYFEENLARLLDHHMSQDFLTQNKFGRGLMVSRNSLNAINLAVSAFHATRSMMPPPAAPMRSRSDSKRPAMAVACSFACMMAAIRRVSVGISVSTSSGSK